MKENLVIIESPYKVKTLQKYLGNNYKVVASVGHIRDLAIGNYKNDLGVDINNDFMPIYEISPSKKKIVSNLKKLVKEAKEVFLATDPDREGEAISWHLAEVLDLDVKTTKRLEYHELTYHAIQEAINNPRTIDLNLVSSQETRRILDRIIGFRLSQLLQDKIGSKSAGRVQSVVLKLIVDRQNEIDSFVEENYYRVIGTLSINKHNVNVTLIDDDNNEIHFKTLKEAQDKIDELSNNEIVMSSFNLENKSRASKPIYTTSSMQQDAANILKFDSIKTMKVAQSLYEGVDVGDGAVGLITYMRTDSIRMNPSFINKTKEVIKEKYGEDYVGVAKIFSQKGNVQDAHEGIRPTDLKITPEIVEEKCSKDQAKLYRLIYQRTVASVMKDEIYEHQSVIFKCKDNKLLATGDRRIFDGFVKELKDMDKVERVPLKLNFNEEIVVNKSSFQTKEGKSKGPIPYNEARLIDTMEKDGIGRPSTYASTLDLIKKRKYVVVNKTYYAPTDQGKLTTCKLDESFSSIINVDYTANMETLLDQIAEGKMTRSAVLSSFYKDFDKLYTKAKKEMIKEKLPLEDLGVCPKCNSPLVKRTSKYGSFIACSGYPNCKYIVNNNKDSKVGQKCPKCHQGELLLRSSKFGKFYACSCYPKCDYKESL